MNNAEITKETMKTIYDRAVQYCIARHGYTPDNVCISHDGTIYMDEDYRLHDCQERGFYVEVSELNADLETIRTKRIEDELKKEKERKELEQKEQERKNKQRFEEYLKLKNEFEK